MDLSAYLKSDVGRGDLTAKLAVPDVDGTAYVVCCEDAVVAGIEEASELFESCGVDATPLAEDGDRVRAGSRVLSVSGPLRGIIACKKTAMGFLSRMTAVATRTAEAVAEADGTPLTSLGLSTPGFGDFVRKAIATGGGKMRPGTLDSAIILRKEHCKACGSLRNALSRLEDAPFSFKKEVEVSDEDEARAAAKAGADIVLVAGKDAAAVKKISEAAKAVSPWIVVEASCGVGDVKSYAGAADMISVEDLIGCAGFKPFRLEMP